MKLSKLLIGVSLIGMSFSGMAANYTVGVEKLDYYPHYAFSGGEYKGYGREILDAFAKAKGHTFTYKALPVQRLFETFAAGGVDFKYPDNSYWGGDSKKGKNVVYSEPVTAYTDGVFVKAADAGKGVAALSTMGIIKGFTAWDLLGDIKAGKIKESHSNDFGSMIKKTLAGRTKGAYGNVSVINYHLNKMGKTGALVFDSKIPHTNSNYHLSTIKHAGVVAEFNTWIKANGALVKSLKAKYSIK